jgi:mRNA interferase MazF
MMKIYPDPTNGLSKPSAIDCFQMRCVSQERLLRKIGEIAPDELEQVIDKMAVVIGYQDI